MKKTTICAGLCVALFAGAAAWGQANKGPTSILKSDKRKATDAPTVITSDRLEFDYNDYIALFDGNVVVTDPQFKMTADRMLVFFENTNDVKRVDAVGRVRMTTDDGVLAVCQKATYTRENGQILMTGDPLIKKGDDNSISGDVISFWLNDGRITVENNVVTKVSSGDEKPEKTPPGTTEKTNAQ